METENEDPTLMDMEVTRSTTIQKMWNLTKIYNTFNETALNTRINEELDIYQTKLVNLVKEGFDGRTNAEKWNFPTALMFTLR